MKPREFDVFMPDETIPLSPLVYERKDGNKIYDAIKVASAFYPGLSLHLVEKSALDAAQARIEELETTCRELGDALENRQCSDTLRDEILDKHRDLLEKLK